LSHETGKICLYCKHWNLKAIHHLHGECERLSTLCGELNGLDFGAVQEDFLTGPYFGCVHWEEGPPAFCRGQK